jgi:hypothetical protein
MHSPEDNPEGLSTDGKDGEGTSDRYRDEVYSRRVPAGKRTYFFDVKTTLSGEDYFITITESKRVGDNRYEKHKIFLYKEDFGKFVDAMNDVVQHVKVECLPDYEFESTPGGPTEDGRPSAIGEPNYKG